MRFCVGFMTAGERVLKWNRKEATNSIAFVFRLWEKPSVAVYEACIDALAHMTLEDGRMNKYWPVPGRDSSTKRRDGTITEEDETSGCIGAFPKEASGGDRD